MPEEHAGRLFDHVAIRVRDVEASRAFYAAVLEPLGLRMTDTGDGGFSVDELFVGGAETPPVDYSWRSRRTA
jgi:catechol 2,3-dioxygenase-like lactoylglutathione lyase family enzyme